MTAHDNDKVSDERIRNYRAWCEARVGSLSGADIGVALCDEVLRLRTSQEWVEGWFLPAHCVNHLQRDSINRVIETAKHAHMVDVDARINGENRRFEADWIKSMVYRPYLPPKGEAP